MKNILILFCLGLVNLFSACQNTVQNDKEDPRPNFIIFYSDELSPDYLGSYGGNYNTPSLDKLAEKGFRFENAYVPASMCTPSRYALITGQFPGRCTGEAFQRNFPVDQPYSVAWNTAIDSTKETLPRVLSRNGYFTGAAGKWHIGNLGQNRDLPEFNDNDNPANPETNAKLQRHQQLVTAQVKKDAGFDAVQSLLWENFDGFPLKTLRVHNIPWITRGAVSLLEKAAQQDKPFFLYLATTAIHGPDHEASLDHDLRYTLEGRLEDVYDYSPDTSALRAGIAEVLPPDQHKTAGLTYLDHHVETVLKALEKTGEAQNTVIIFMADHNVEPGKATCYQKGVKVPFIMYLPRQNAAGKRTQLVENVDIYPTILELSGIPLPENYPLDGISLLPVLEENRPVRDLVYFESGYARSISDGQFQYVAFRYPQKLLKAMKTGAIDYAPNQLGNLVQSHSQIAIEHYPHYFDPDQLYNLQTDPYQQRNLAGHPEYQSKLEEMQEKLQNQLATFRHPFPLEIDPFLQTTDYEILKEKTIAQGTGNIPWLKEHHGKLHWPPVK